jgi:hypothetical protein
MMHRITTDPQQPLVALADGNESLVAVGASWFASAFEVAIGSTIEEALQRFSDELRAILDAQESRTAAISDTECLQLVRRLQWRMSVAAEWATRLDRMSEETKAGAQ